jgi:hypothetical protein
MSLLWMDSKTDGWMFGWLNNKIDGWMRKWIDWLNVYMDV